MKKVFLIIVIAMAFFSCDYFPDDLYLTVNVVNGLGKLYSYDLTVNGEDVGDSFSEIIHEGTYTAHIDVFAPDGAFLLGETKTKYCDATRNSITFYLYHVGPIGIEVK